MKLANSNYGLNITFQDGDAYVLVLENPRLMRQIIEELVLQCAGEDGDFVLSDNKIVKIEKHLDLIVDPFALDFQNRKITTALFAKMSRIGNEKIIEKNVINSTLVSIIDDISSAVNYSGITYQLDFSWSDLFKIYGVKIDAPENFLVRIIEYMKILFEFCGISIFCFVNLKNYLLTEELLQLYESVKYNKLKILLIESYEADVLDGEHIIIIDKDHCLIEK